MFTVYWTVVVDPNTDDYHRQCSTYDGSLPPELPLRFEPRMQQLEKITDALDFCEDLRRQRRGGARLSAITMVSENPDSVGEAGVNDKLPEGYDWKKRRV